MCFHAQQTQSQKTVHQYFGTKGPVATGLFNGFSNPRVTVITDEDPKITSLHQWGLIPHWSKDKDIQKYTLNAKVETLDQKPSFRSARRCLFVSDGFYEWQWQDPKGKKKQKYLLTHADQILFSFAGLWDQWKDHSTGDIIRSISIVTTAARGIMCEIHNNKQRMPLTLTAETETQWLEGIIPEPFYDFSAKAVY